MFLHTRAIFLQKTTRVCGDFPALIRSRGSRFPSTSGDRDLRQERSPYKIRRVRPGSRPRTRGARC